MDNNYRVIPENLIKTIKLTIDQYKAERNNANSSRISNLLYNMELCKELLINQKNDFKPDDFEKYFNELNVCIGQIKRGDDIHMENRNRQKVNRLGFSAMWLLGVISGIGLFALIILGALYL